MKKKPFALVVWLENRLFGEVEIGMYAHNSKSQSEQS
jgi:hypothetical protein